ncbi:MAG TPA: hypothetical protein VF522_05385 [Ramlibacter sp.]|uniref:hypothetical protein n=1 Tax=Ramlibacter sp. TaxID=1917967 RepID=UPI002ED30396
MDAKPTSSSHIRPGTTSSWMTVCAAGSDDARDGQAPMTPRPDTDAGTLDPVRTVFWQAYRHLFPPHALPAQTPGGSLVISWSVMDDPHAHHPYAVPVLLRFHEALLDAMGAADARMQLQLAQEHEPALREGLRGYDPFAHVPDARVVTIG